MDDRFNTIAGWALFSGIVALGLASLSSRYFEAGKDTPPEKAGYPIEGVATGGGAKKEVPFAALLAKADPAKGAQIFKRCQSCHTDTQGGPNGMGPNLYGIVGSAVAEGRGGFDFSSALKKVGGKWTFDKLNKWLTSPKGLAPGTKMTFAGLDKAQDRADVIAYLNTQGSNLPLPKAPPPAPATAEASSGAAAGPATIEDRLAKADPAKGAQIFKRCMACHTIKQGAANGMGPNLYGIVGSKVAEGRGGFDFSSALKKVGGEWTFAKLDKWLTSPREFAPGTKMTFAGLSNPDDRADVIAYLNSQGSNVPVKGAAKKK